MREKPIIFSTEMVRAILDGCKTMTRRIIHVDISNQFDVDVDGSVCAYVCPETGDSYKRAFELLYRKTDQIIPKEWFLETVKQVKKTWESGVI